MWKTMKVVRIVAIVALLSLAIASPAAAFEGREGDTVLIQAGEVIDDDLYVGATTFTMEGTVNGDVIAFGQLITINGTVTGNLITGANTVIINGSVGGDVWAAGAALYWGPEANVAGDVLGAGASLEFSEGAEIGRDLLGAAGQVLLGADVARNANIGAGGLEISGRIGGDVNAQVGEATAGQPQPRMWTGQTSIALPNVPPGLTIDPRARIEGDLTYTQNAELAIPAALIGGRVERLPQPAPEGAPKPAATTAEKAAAWALTSLRSLVTLLLLGLLLLWLVPRFTRALSEFIRGETWKSLGWGLIAYAAAIALMVLTLVLLIMLGVLFGVVKLGGLSATVVWTGLLLLLGLILGFVLFTTLLAKIVFGQALGEWIFKKAGSPLSEHRFWPMLVGVAITVVVLALLALPGVPGVFAWLLNAAIVLFGLGALALRILWVTRKQPA